MLALLTDTLASTLKVCDFPPVAAVLPRLVSWAPFLTSSRTVEPRDCGAELSAPDTVSNPSRIVTRLNWILTGLDAVWIVAGTLVLFAMLEAALTASENIQLPVRGDH